MDILYEKGEMLVKHPSGHINKYNRIEVEEWRNGLLTEQSDVNEKIQITADYIEKIDLSTGAI